MTGYRRRAAADADGPCLGKLPLSRTADCRNPQAAINGRRQWPVDRHAGLYDDIWQAFAALLPVQTVGVMRDGRTYDFGVGLRAVTSTGGMTATSIRST